MGSNWDSFPQGRDVGQGQLTDDLSVTKGRHTLKFGENYRNNRVSDFGLLTSTIGWYAFNSLTDFANGVTDPTPSMLLLPVFHFHHHRS